MKRLSTTTLTLILALGGMPLIAAAGGDHGAHAGIDHGASSATSAPAATDTSLVDGEVKKVDREQGKVTIKHAELKNLGMPGMTMVFQVKDKSMLDQVKAGDQIAFVADKIDGKFTVTQMEPKN
ncbi:copper-binding protein [Oxalobacteraceae bacterium R-40]|uniref:Copper-binding protein n=1 Tax=Keguizhuia sedimenti TaxID=3064264 RepID=A0ABU1BT13_9BURK|nr:copper-binding protein [Oxalobacteraceae bacterium R-40]